MTLKPETKNAIIGFTISTFIVMSASFVGHAYADRGPSKADLKNISDIQKNQKKIAELKEWNRLEAEQLSKNGFQVDWKTATIKDNDVYAWENAPEYKNERLAYYQKLLKDRGITNKDHVKLLVAQLIQEAGSLSETTIGDHGCSFGIIQYNACAHKKISAKRFLEIHPEWKTWEYQLEQMANMVKERYALYDGNIKRVIVHHNRPATARAGSKDTPAGYFKAISSRTNLLVQL